MFANALRKMKEVQFFALMALLVAVESILVFSGVLPPMMEGHIGHSIFFLLRMAVFICFAWTLAGKPVLQTLVKGAAIALAGVVTEVIFVFIAKATGRVLLGIATPGDTLLYIALAISAVINALFGAVIVSIAAWIFSQMAPKPSKAKASAKLKRRKR
jgi:hypothetical protein